MEMMELSCSAMAAMLLFPLLWLLLVLVDGYSRNKNWKAPKVTHSRGVAAPTCNKFVTKP